MNSTTLKECGPCQRVTSPYDILSADSTEKTVHRMVEEWTGLAWLYDAVVHFAAAYQGGILTIDPIFTLKVQVVTLMHTNTSSKRVYCIILCMY